MDVSLRITHKSATLTFANEMFSYKQFPALLLLKQLKYYLDPCDILFKDCSGPAPLRLMMVIFADLKQSILTAMWGMWTLPFEISKALLFSLDSGRQCVTHFFSKPASCLCYLYLRLPTLTQILPSKPSGRHVSKPGCGMRTASSESGRRAMEERRAEKVQRKYFEMSWPVQGTFLTVTRDRCCVETTV